MQYFFSSDDGFHWPDAQLWLGITSCVSHIFGRWLDCPGPGTDGKVSNNAPKMTDFKSQPNQPNGPLPVNFALAA
jgi:hypothetical protein